MNTAELRSLLDATLDNATPHVERMTVTAAVISELLRARGMETTLVGGGAIEFYAPQVYTTTDIDLIIEGPRDVIDAELNTLGFVRRGRHWIRDDLFVEVPGNWMSDPVSVVEVGPLTLRVIRRETVLADRIIGFKHWRSSAYGAQSIALLAAFGDTIDEAVLTERLRAEDAEDALSLLRELASADEVVNDDALQRLLARLDKARDDRRTHE